LTIDKAQADGSWPQTDAVDALIIPADLEAAFAAPPAARKPYGLLIESAKKEYL
jgi:uncharacterized protein YdeI (YjbR/CyaY-like superfamily)